jgi:hypothetical protein
MGTLLLYRFNIATTDDLARVQEGLLWAEKTPECAYAIALCGHIAEGSGASWDGLIEWMDEHVPLLTRRVSLLCASQRSCGDVQWISATCGMMTDAGGSEIGDTCFRAIQGLDWERTRNLCRMQGPKRVVLIDPADLPVHSPDLVSNLTTPLGLTVRSGPWKDRSIASVAAHRDHGCLTVCTKTREKNGGFVCYDTIRCSSATPSTYSVWMPSFRQEVASQRYADHSHPFPLFCAAGYASVVSAREQ